MRDVLRTFFTQFSGDFLIRRGDQSSQTTEIPFSHESVVGNNYSDDVTVVGGGTDRKVGYSPSKTYPSICESPHEHIGTTRT